ncbi:MAG TPA: lanthionine synthetase C family protein [Polyangiaceae bacterium]|nr:lanthionine synthetase C family protein [Polyangiaceae bacterium]
MWAPLLDGELGERAREALGAIAARLVATDDSERGASLASGAAGDAVVLDVVAQACVSAALDEAARTALDRAIDEVANETMAAGLYVGFTGVAWALECLRDDDDEDANEEVDRALLEHLEEPIWRGDYDLVSGLAGLGLYGLERRRHASGRACFARVLDHLETTARHLPEGVAWWTSPDLLLPERRAEHPEGFWNVGLAHGVPGVVGVLARAYAANVERARVAPLLEGAVRWVLAQARAGDARFPYFAGDAEPARTAWCYGDPGVAAALMAAGRATGEAAWERRALELARAATERTDDGVVDAGLCHGRAGLGQIFHRFFRATGDEIFAEAARTELTRALDFGEPGGRYRAWAPDAQGILGWIDDSTLLAGSGGVALALASALSTEAPTWDRVLLLDL